mmetsp:Transcript_36374/g.112533  ORF Transcript_36374/g.112533 Transcript_36374/m.112533 type:complete len:265 (-) Transcript_36374:372-1166(-)
MTARIFRGCVFIPLMYIIGIRQVEAGFIGLRLPAEPTRKEIVASESSVGNLRPARHASKSTDTEYERETILGRAKGLFFEWAAECRQVPISIFQPRAKSVIDFSRRAERAQRHAFALPSRAQRSRPYVALAASDRVAQSASGHLGAQQGRAVEETEELCEHVVRHCVQRRARGVGVVIRRARGVGAMHRVSPGDPRYDDLGNLCANPPIRATARGLRMTRATTRLPDATFSVSGRARGLDWTSAKRATAPRYLDRARAPAARKA